MLHSFFLGDGNLYLTLVASNAKRLSLLEDMNLIKVLMLRYFI